MSENLKTIKELADELGVSKTYIENIIRKVNIHSELQKKGNRFFLSIKQQKIVKNFLSKSPTQSPTAVEESPTKPPTAVEEFLQNELIKRGLEIAKLHELLDQQQRLALQDKKMLEEYKSEINDLKSPRISSQEIERGQVDSQLQEELEWLKNENYDLQEQLEKQIVIESKEIPRKWWQFWK